MKLKFLHLIPNNGYGGVENAASHFSFFEKDNFSYQTIFISKHFKNNEKFIKKNIEIIKDYYKTFLCLISKKNTVLIISLWKSSLLSLLVKLFNKEIKLILFLHSTKNKHFIDYIFTSLNLLIVDEIWADSLKTLEKRQSSLLFKKSNIDKKVISFRLKRLKPLKINTVKPNFIYWGRLNKGKDISSSIKLFKMFCAEFRNANFKIIGKDEGLRIFLEKQVSDYGLNNNVQFYDFMEMRDLIFKARDCSFFIQLSLYEGMACSVVESMQLGLVPIVRNVGEIENYCKNNFNSIIYEDENKTFGQVKKIINNKNLYLKIRKNAIKIWENKPIYHEDIVLNCEAFQNRYKNHFLLN